MNIVCIWCALFVLYELEEEQTSPSLLPPVATGGNERSADWQQSNISGEHQSLFHLVRWLSYKMHKRNGAYYLTHIYFINMGITFAEFK